MKLKTKTSLLLIFLASFVSGLIAAAPVAASGQATFIRTDTTTQGNWQGAYGLDGYVMAGINTNKTAGYAAFTPENNANWTWTSNGTEVRDLQVPSSSVRQASCWYSSGSYFLDVNITDGNTHQFALYALDWDSKGRAETIQAVDGVTGAVLDTQSLSNFTNGIYYIWNVSGHVKFTVIQVSGPNAVISGAFFDIATATSAPGIATFVATDTSTQGNWRGIYGADGYTVVGDSPSTPAYAALASVNQSSWTWASSTTDPRALQLGSGLGRIAATWYSIQSFSIDIDITDGNSHRVALYALDWDSKGRTEAIQVVDPQTQAVLDSRSVSSFTNGIYVVWNISGHVRFNVTTTSGPNATISGVFLGGGSSTGGTGGTGPVTVTTISGSGSGGATATFLPPQDTTTEGNWIGKYGADGYSLAMANQNVPAYAAMNVTAKATWAWANPTSDLRGLQLPPSGSSRIAATWYGPSTVTLDINLTDGQQHEISVYAIDWANKGQSQTFQVQDAASGATLDTEPMPSFGSGAYLSWNVSGHVRIVATLNSGDNAVVSGVFFGGASTGSSNGGGTGGSGSPAVPATINAVAFNGIDTTTQGAWKGIGNFNAPPASSSLVYGKDGVVLPDTEGCDAACNPFPSYVSFGPQGVNSSTPGNVGAKPYSSHAYVDLVQGSPSVMGPEPQNATNTNFFQCNYTNSNPAAPWAPMVAWRPTTDTREISNWYTCSGVTSFYLEFSFGTSTHNFEVYVVDDQNGGTQIRSEELQVLDGDTNAVLYDSGSFTNFTGGVYYKWSITGHVKVKVINTSTSGTNAVINGAFFN
jgi:hypothetical protein